MVVSPPLLPYVVLRESEALAKIHSLSHRFMVYLGLMDLPSTNLSSPKETMIVVMVRSSPSTSPFAVDSIILAASSSNWCHTLCWLAGAYFIQGC